MADNNAANQGGLPAGQPDPNLGGGQPAGQPQGQPDLAAVLQGQQATTNAIAQLIALLQQQQGLGGQQQQQQQGNITYHQSPAQAESTRLLNMGVKGAGLSTYIESQKGCEHKYDLSKKGLKAFVDRTKAGGVRLACAIQGTHSVCHFTAEDGGPELNVLDHYGQITIERIKTQAAPYINGPMRNSRQAQNNNLFCDYLLNSLTSDANETIMTYATDFTMSGKYVFGLLWKRIVAIPSLDNPMTAKLLRRHLRELPNEINQLGVLGFNKAFTSDMTQLQARGKDNIITDADDIAIEAYKNVEDHRFAEYFKDRDRDRIDGVGVLADATWEEILSKGETQFRLYEKDWGQISPEQERFLALQASLKGGLKMKSPPNGSASKSKGKANASSKPPAAAAKKNKKPTADRKRQKKDESWKKIPPKDGEPTSKTVDGWSCHWCIHHMAWCGHTSTDCQLGKRHLAEQQASRKTYKAALSTTTMSEDPAVSRQMGYMAKLANLSKLNASD